MTDPKRFDPTGFNVYDTPAMQTYNAAPDGITPDEWRRGIAILAASQMGGQYGTSVQSSIDRAGEIVKWIKEGKQ